MWIDTGWAQRGSRALWWSESLTRAFLLASSGQSPGSESVSGASQGPPLCACASLSQDGFQCRGLWVGWHHLLWGGAPFLSGQGSPQELITEGSLPRAAGVDSGEYNPVGLGA